MSERLSLVPIDLLTRGEEKINRLNEKVNDDVR